MPDLWIIFIKYTLNGNNSGTIQVPKCHIKVHTLPHESLRFDLRFSILNCCCFCFSISLSPSLTLPLFLLLLNSSFYVFVTIESISCSAAGRIILLLIIQLFILWLSHYTHTLRYIPFISSVQRSVLNWQRHRRHTSGSS